MTLTLAELQQANIPRVVIQFSRDQLGREQFSWGVEGNIPLTSLVGAIAGVQHVLIVEEIPLIHQCQEWVLVLYYDERRTEAYDYIVHPEIPMESLIGMLELIKQTFVGTLLSMQMQQSKPRVLGPDGSPMRR